MSKNPIAEAYSRHKNKPLKIPKLQTKVQVLLIALETFNRNLKRIPIYLHWRKLLQPKTLWFIKRCVWEIKESDIGFRRGLAWVFIGRQKLRRTPLLLLDLVRSSKTHVAIRQIDKEIRILNCNFRCFPLLLLLPLFFSPVSSNCYWPYSRKWPGASRQRRNAKAWNRRTRGPYGVGS